MKVSLLIGVVSSLVIWVLAMIMHDWSLVYQISGAIGVIFVFLACVFSGALVSGNRMRANFRYEDSKDRNARLNFATKLLLIGLPNIITTILCVMYMHPPIGS